MKLRLALTCNNFFQDYILKRMVNFFGSFLMLCSIIFPKFRDVCPDLRKGQQKINAGAVLHDDFLKSSKW